MRGSSLEPSEPQPFRFAAPGDFSRSSAPRVSEEFSGVVRPPSAIQHRRARRRGPRSAAALLRRRTLFDRLRFRVDEVRDGYASGADGWSLDPLPVLPRLPARGEAIVNVRGSREAEPHRSFFSDFCIFHCNIRGYLSHRAELDGQLRMLDSPPAMVCLNETFLDESVADSQLGLSGYALVSRRDRRDGRSGGGILCFAAQRLAEQIVLCEHSEVDERTWHILHSDIGPILCGVWYRPPCGGETASISSCEEEWRRLSASYVASILVGDLNVHHKRWLRFSSGVSVEGTALFRFSMATGLKHHVKAPT